MSVSWRLEDVNAGAYDDRLLDVPDCTLAYNRFARSAAAVLDDPDGSIPTEYPRGTPVDLEVQGTADTDFRTRFGGFVNGYDSGNNTTTLNLLSHDNWLRTRDVYRSFTNTAKSTIIAELVDDLTPLTVDASRIDVYDDAPITESWSGVSLDKVLENLAAASNGELFGATNDMVFFFEQRDSSRAPRDFTEGEYFRDSVQFSEDGSKELNEVTVYYGGDPADQAVVVSDAAAQRELADELGADEPVVIADSKTYADITSEEAARRKARQLLEGATTIQTGELTTWEAFDIDPGDLVRVVVPDQGIDDEYRVAEISHSWMDDETPVKLAENSDGVVDALVELSDEVSRVEARAASNDATITRFTPFDLPFEIEWTLNAYRRSIPDDALLWGATKGGWGDPAAGGGRWGDQRGEREQLIEQ